MADTGDLDLYADDLEHDFSQEDCVGDPIDLYDDVIAGQHSTVGASSDAAAQNSNALGQRNDSSIINHSSMYGQSGRKFQLYVGNLTWWTTDQDIQDAITSLGVQDFLEVKFFENRPNGQSKGFCIISLGSEQSMRVCIERLPKKELHGQSPVVTYTTKEARTQFESQTKARSVSPSNTQNQYRMQQSQAPPPHSSPTQMHNNRMAPPGMQTGPRMPSVPHMSGPGPQDCRVPYRPSSAAQGYKGPPRVPAPVPHAGPLPNQQHPGFHNWQNGMRQNGPPRPPPGPPQSMAQPRPGGPPLGMQFQGPPPPGQGPPPRAGPLPGIPGGPPHPPPDQRGPPPRQDWNRPPGMQVPGFMGHQQNMPGLQGPPVPGQGPLNRGPPPPQMVGPQGGNTSHGNPQFFNQGPPQGPPQTSHGPPHPPAGYGPPPPARMHHPYVGGPPAPDHRAETPTLTEAEFEEIMARNRIVSSSAITRAVADVSAAEYASAIETLVTAMSLIKQSKAANDDRCKILISALQDTLHGVEAKRYRSAKRERSRSREKERAHRRSRRERSRSRERDYRERSRERERDKDRYYADSYPRERSRSREREYRERSREDSTTRQSVRSRIKSPDPPDTTSVGSSKSRYYDDRYRERDRDRDRERESSRRDPERDRDRERERERDRERERAESSHRSSRH